MKIPRKVIFIAGTAALMGLVFPYANSAVDQTYQQLKTIVDVLELIKENYVEEIDSQKLIYGAAAGMVQQLDDFSQFMEPDLYKRVKSDTEGEFGGIGIRVDVREGWLTIVTPLPNTPAYRAGLYPGDKIIKIEGESTRDMIIDEAIKRLRGTPGTKVNITTAREPEGKDADADWVQRDVTLVRELIKTEAVRYKMLDGKIGYVKLIDFTGHVVDDVGRALGALKAEG
ncbi:MAG TPA: PDZ domain-containing protein, partial [Elusimicrobiales bacterium]|nr:PDZ domain-containing protein [Elusimicrobiales bacterium]